MRTLRLTACTVDLLSGQVQRTDGTTDRLPPRELELLSYLAHREGQAVSRDELHERVWNHSPDVVSRAADVTMQRLRKKVEADPGNPDHLLTQFGAGYTFVGPPQAPGAAAPEAEPMVGRVGEIEELTRRLTDSGGIVSLVGPPGAGKTRLARHLAWRLSSRLIGGTRFCDLTESADLDDVVRAVARALDLSLAGSTELALERLGHALAAMGPILLVLDNCEQVLAGAGEVAERLAAAAPDLRLVATSREALGCEGEHVARVGPLDHDAAVELFVTLARRVRPGFDLDDEDQAVVVERLVERLERLALALALAAGRIGALSPQHLLDRIDERFRLLQSRARDVDPRQRTLLAAVDWSWDMLTTAERAALAQAASFRGGFDDEAARAVIAVEGADPVELLGRLVARSLLERRAQRYGAFAFIREYAERRLAEAPDVEQQTYLRHAAHYASLGANRAERDNLRAAAERCIALGRGELAGAAGLGLTDLYKAEGPLDQVCVVAEAVLGLADLRPRDEVMLQLRHVSVQLQTGLTDAEDRLADAMALAQAVADPGLEAQTYRMRGHLNRQRGRRDQAEADLLHAVQTARAGDDGEELANALSSLGLLYRELGQYDRARTAFEDLLAIHDDYDLKAHRSYTYSNLGQLARREGRTEDARQLYALSLEAALELEDGFVETTTRIGVGNLHLELGELDEARASYERAQTLARRMGLLHMEGQILGNLGIVARAQGDLAGSRAISERALEIFEATTNPREAALALANLGDLDLAEGKLDDAEVKLTRAGRTLRALGDGLSEAEVLGPLAELALARGELERARSHLEVSEAEARRQGHPMAIAQALARRGLLEVASGLDARATLAEAASLVPDPGPDVARLLARLRAAISAA